MSLYQGLRSAVSLLREAEIHTVLREHPQKVGGPSRYRVISVRLENYSTHRTKEEILQRRKTIMIDAFLFNILNLIGLYGKAILVFIEKILGL